MNKKSQTEITNVIFMHLIGLIGIFTFTFLFISLITSSSSRAEGLKTDALYNNYGRRLISSSDCLAYSRIETYYSSSGFETFSRVIPGMLDMSKFFDYEHQNCLRYDMVSGGASSDPSNPFASYPVVYYEMTVKDLTNNMSFITLKGLENTTNLLDYFTANAGVYVSTTQAVTYEICDKTGTRGCTTGCMYDCDDLREYISNLNNGIPDTPDIVCTGETRSLTNVNPGSNCWTDEFNNVIRIVQPYSPIVANSSVNFNCSIPSVLSGTTSESGNVYERVLSYPVILRYPGFRTNYSTYNSATFDDLGFIEHVGLFTVRFCVIKIPTMCDPFFRYTYRDTLMGLYSAPVFNPTVCETGGLPQI